MRYDVVGTSNKMRPPVTEPPFIGSQIALVPPLPGGLVLVGLILVGLVLIFATVYL